MQTKKAYSSQDRMITEAIYIYCLRENLDDGWVEEDQLANFEKLLEIAQRAQHPLKGASVLDVGCGTGDLVDVLTEQGISEYLGVDIVMASVDLARVKRPEHRFEVADFLAMELTRPYDFVLASGAMSVRLETDNYVVMEAFIEKMWKAASKGVAFNFLVPQHEGQRDDALFLYEPGKILAFCEKVAPEARVEHVLNKAGQAQFQQCHVYLYGKP
jgi:SAM-dependent methyltransferase